MSESQTIDDVIIDPEKMQVVNLLTDNSGQEATAMGNPSFPLAVFHTDLRRNVLGYTNWHWNKELQLCLVVSTFRESVFERKYFVPFFESPALECVTFSDSAGWQRDILSRIKAISNARYLHQDGYELEILSDLITIWRLMVQNIKLTDTKRSRRSRNNELVNAILGYIMEHYSMRIRIEYIAAAVHSSPS